MRGGPEDPFGNVTRIANGNTFTGTNTFTGFTYDTFGDLVEVIDQDGNIRSISYNVNGEQVVTEFYYYATDQRPPTQSQIDDVNVTITAADYPASRTLLRTENDLNFAGDVTGSRTYVTERTLDAATLSYIDGETMIRNEGGFTEFDALGRAFRQTDENGRVSETVFDARGLAIETRSESPDETGSGVWLISRTVYDSEGRSVYSTGSFPEGSDPSQVTGTHTVYEDGTGLVTETQQLLGITIDIVASSTNLGTQVSSLASAGTVISSSRSFYDDNDRVIETENNYGLKSQTLYDVNSRVIESRSETIASDGSRSWLVSRTIYDNEGKVIASTDRFLVPFATHLGADPVIPVTTQISKTIYDDRDRSTATERYTGAIVGGLITSPKADVAPAGFQILNEGDLESVSETLYDAGGRVYRTISGRLPTVSLSGIAPTQSQALANYPIYGSDVDRYAGMGLSSGVISDTLFDDRGRQYASLGHPLPAEDLGLSGDPYDGNLVRVRSETIYNGYGQTELSRSGLAHVETTNGTFVDVVNQQSVDNKPTYDAFGNVVRTDMITGGAISYDAAAERTTRSDGSVHSYTLTRFDDENRPVAEMQQTAGDVTAVWSDNENSFVIDSTSTHIPTKLYIYDADDRLAVVELPAVANPNNGGTIERPRYEYAYDERGNQTGIVDPLGNETRFTFTDRGQQATRTLPLGFGDDGVFGTSDDAAASDFSESITDDDLGRQHLHISFEGVVTENVYDSYGRMSAMRYYADETAYAGGSGVPDEIRVFAFDQYGRRFATTFVENPTSTDPATGTVTRVEQMFYDDRSRVLAEQTPEGVFGYGYDNLGRMTHTAVFSAGADPFTDTPERVTSYSYDILGRLVSAQEDATPADGSDDTQDTGYGFDLQGRKRAQLTFAPGDTDATIATSYLYDDVGRLDVMSDTDSDGNTLASYDYTVRADGKRISSTETFWFDENQDGGQTANELKTNSYSWTYDDANRLTDEVLDHWDNAFDQTESFQYDLTGNRVSLERDKGNNGTVDEAITYSYDANDRLLDEVLDSLVDADDTTTTYAYDHTQQTEKLVTRNVSTGQQTVSRQAFTYNLQGRMASVTNEGYDSSGVLNSRERTSYKYNSGSYRVELTNETDAALDNNFTLSSRIEFLANSRNFTGYTQTVRETTFDASGKVTKTIDYTFGSDEISQRVRELDSSGNFTSDETLVFGHDGHGSVRVLYDLSGAATQIIQAFTFSAYGQMIALHNTAAQSIAVSSRLSSTGYSGETFDSASQQQYLRARFYNPENSRFNRLDDFAGNNQDPKSLHKYAYVHGDPIQGIDPSGLIGVISVKMAISLGAISGGFSGYANYRAGRSVGLGLVGGIYGSSALYAAYVSKGSSGAGEVFWEDFVAGAIASGVSYIFAAINGNPAPTGWATTSLVVEGLNFGMGYKQWIDPFASSKSITGYFGAGLAQAGVNIALTGGAATLDIHAYAVEVIYHALFNGPDDVRQAKKELEKNYKDYINILYAALLEVTVIPVANIAIEKLAGKIPGLRALPPTTKREIALKLADILATATPVAVETIRQASDIAAKEITDWLFGEKEQVNPTQN